MAVSLYDLSVPCFLQTVTAVEGFLAKGSAHLAEHGPEPAEVVEARLWPDMLPFRFQIWSVAHHSLGAIKGVQAGAFAPPAPLPELDYAGLQKVVAETRSALAALTPQEVDALEGREVTFRMRDLTIPFVAEGFLLSFSLPNLHFHAATAYDILRSKGVPLGKRDFMGPLQIKR